MEIKEIFQNIKWKSFIIGAALFAFIVVASVDYKLDVLLIFSSVGLLYIGYASNGRIQGSILGALGTLPLFIVTVYTQRLGSITGDNLIIWILISFLAIGAFCGFTGSYFNSARQKAIEKKEAIGKGKKKEKGKKTKT